MSNTKKVSALPLHVLGLVICGLLAGCNEASQSSMKGANPLADVDSETQTARVPSQKYMSRVRKAEELWKQAAAAAKSGAASQAVSLYRQAIEVNDTGFLRLDLIDLLLREKRSKEALQEFDALFDSKMNGDFRNSPTVLNRYASLCEQSGRAKEAEAMYRNVLAGYQPATGTNLPSPMGKPKDSKRLKAMAKVIEGIEFAGTTEDRKGLGCFEEATHIDPTYGLAHLYVGYVRQSLGKAGVQESLAAATANGDPQVKAAASAFKTQVGRMGAPSGASL